MSSDNSTPSDCHSGFICLAGPTNAGKSTLMNAIIGQKIAIITPKPQTTRNRILGIHTVAGRGQAVFVDTPGFHKPVTKLGHRMNDLAARSLADTDVVLLVVDVSLDANRPGHLAEPNRRAIERVREASRGTMVALNKVDQVRSKDVLLPIIQTYATLAATDDIYPVSALTGLGLAELEQGVFARLPQGPYLYPEDVLSDQVERFMAAEVIREKAILFTRQELPYSIAVEVESFKEPADGSDLLSIAALIHVERDSQKAIAIGKGGAMIKKIGTEARKDLETMFSTRVFLELNVRVTKDWSQDPRSLDRLGYR